MARNSVQRDHEFVRIREFRRVRGMLARVAPASPRTAVPGFPLGCVSQTHYGCFVLGTPNFMGGEVSRGPVAGVRQCNCTYGRGGDMGA